MNHSFFLSDFFEMTRNPAGFKGSEKLQRPRGVSAADHEWRRDVASALLIGSSWAWANTLRPSMKLCPPVQAIPNPAGVAGEQKQDTDSLEEGTENRRFLF